MFDGLLACSPGLGRRGRGAWIGVCQVMHPYQQLAKVAKLATFATAAGLIKKGSYNCRGFPPPDTEKRFSRRTRPPGGRGQTCVGSDQYQFQGSGKARSDQSVQS